MLTGNGMSVASISSDLCAALRPIPVIVAVVLLFAGQAGADWLNDWQLTQNTYVSRTSPNHARCVATDSSGGVHVVWTEFYGYGSDVYYSRLDSTGWSAPKRLNEETGYAAEGPSIAIGSAGEIHVVWYIRFGSGMYEEAAVLYRRFDGSSWDWPEWLWNVRDGTPSPCVVCTPGNDIRILFTEKINEYSVLFITDLAYQSDEVLAWQLSEITSVSADAGSDGSLHVVWREETEDTAKIFYISRYTEEWSEPEQLVSSLSDMGDPSIAASGGTVVHVVWAEQSEDRSQVFYKARQGSSWNTQEPLTDTEGHPKAPVVSIDTSGDAHVAWMDDRDGNWNVYYTRQEGASWLDTQRITDTTSNSEDPGLAVDSYGHVNVVWSDDRTGNYEIFWKKWFDGTLPALDLVAADPASAFSGDSLDALSLSGEAFVAPVLVWMEMEGEPTLYPTDIKVLSADTIQCRLDLYLAHHGYRDVIVMNPDGRCDTLRAGFRVTPFPKPQATSIEPAAGETGLGVQITGLGEANFVSPVSVWFERAGEDRLDAMNINVLSPDSLSFALSLGGVSQGTWDMIVENPDGRRDTLLNAFEVVAGRWSEDCRLTDNRHGSMTGYTHSRAVATDGQGHVHVVWYDNRSGHNEVYYKMFDGTHWSPDLVLTLDDWRSAHPAIAVGPDGSVHIAWHDRRDESRSEPYYLSEIYYKELTPSGWGPDVRITEAAGESREPSIAVDKRGNVHVVWYDNRRPNRWQIFYRCLDGEEWKDEVPLTQAPGSHELPSVAVDDSFNVHVVWHGSFDDPPGNEHIYYSRFDETRWFGPTKVNQGNEIGQAPTVAAVGNSVHFTWHDACFGDSCAIHHRAIQGDDWLVEEILTAAQYPSKNATVAVDNVGHVHVVWQDEHDGSQEIYYKLHDGIGWQPDIRLTATGSLSRKPSLAVSDAGRVHVVWHDDRDNNWEIYYKSKAPDSEPPPVPLALLTIRSVAPNPTFGSSTVWLQAERSGRVDLSLYDVMGRLVWKTDIVAQPPGVHPIVWPGVDSKDREVAPGIYFARAESRSGKASAKIIVLK